MRFWKAFQQFQITSRAYMKFCRRQNLVSDQRNSAIRANPRPKAVAYMLCYLTRGGGLGDHGAGFFNKHERMRVIMGVGLFCGGAGKPQALRRRRRRVAGTPEILFSRSFSAPDKSHLWIFGIDNITRIIVWDARICGKISDMHLYVKSERFHSFSSPAYQKREKVKFPGLTWKNLIGWKSISNHHSLHTSHRNTRQAPSRFGGWEGRASTGAGGGVEVW